jgi:hypothetical protein
MTAAAPADHAAASRLVAALEHAWTTIRSHHPDVPHVVIVVASGSDARSRRLNLGHFAAGRWQLTNPDTPTNGLRCWSAAKASNAARSISSAPCCMRPPTAWPMPARSATPAARAVATTAWEDAPGPPVGLTQQPPGDMPW